MSLLPVIILAGGRSSRFGSNKARAVLPDGRPLILALAAELAPAASSITVVAARAGQYEDLGLATLADRRPGLGPLGGLATILADPPGDWFFVTACDFVGASADWVGHLAASRHDAIDCVLFRDGRPQPLFALYHRRIAARVARRLAARRLDLQSLVVELPRIELAPPPGWSRAANVNTRAALNDWIETTGVPVHA